MLKIEQLDGQGAGIRAQVSESKAAHFLSHPTASAKEQMPSQAGLSTQQGGSDTWDTVTSEEVEGNLTVYSILLVPEGTILNCPSPAHILSHIYTDTLSISLSNQLAVLTESHISLFLECARKSPRHCPCPQRAHSFTEERGQRDP